MNKLCNFAEWQSSRVNLLHAWLKKLSAFNIQWRKRTEEYLFWSKLWTTNVDYQQILAKGKLSLKPDLLNSQHTLEEFHFLLRFQKELQNRLSVQKGEYEAAITRHQNFIDQVSSSGQSLYPKKVFLTASSSVNLIKLIFHLIIASIFE